MTVHTACSARIVAQMTTTIEDDMTHILMRFVRCTETITAEHHPDDHGGMKFVIHIEGGMHTGTVIHCATNASVLRLFDSIVAARKSGIDHPYLAAV